MQSDDKKLHWKVITGRKEFDYWQECNIKLLRERQLNRYSTAKLAKKICLKNLIVLIKVNSERQSERSTRFTSNSDTLINSDEYDFKRNSVVSLKKSKSNHPLFLQQQQKNWFIKRKQIVSNDMGI